jgi:hypothetical protein
MVRVRAKMPTTFPGVHLVVCTEGVRPAGCACVRVCVRVCLRVERCHTRGPCQRLENVNVRASRLANTERRGR